MIYLLALIIWLAICWFIIKACQWMADLEKRQQAMVDNYERTRSS